MIFSFHCTLENNQSSKVFFALAWDSLIFTSAQPKTNPLIGEPLIFHPRCFRFVNIKRLPRLILKPPPHPNGVIRKWSPSFSFVLVFSSHVNQKTTRALFLVRFLSVLSWYICFLSMCISFYSSFVIIPLLHLLLSCQFYLSLSLSLSCSRDSCLTRSFSLFVLILTFHPFSPFDQSKDLICFSPKGVGERIFSLFIVFSSSSVRFNETGLLCFVFVTYTSCIYILVRKDKPNARSVDRCSPSFLKLFCVGLFGWLFFSMAILFYKYMHLDRIRMNFAHLIRSATSTSRPRRSRVINATANRLDVQIWGDDPTRNRISRWIIAIGSFCLSSISLVLSLLLCVIDGRIERMPISSHGNETRYTSLYTYGSSRLKCLLNGEYQPTVSFLSPSLSRWLALLWWNILYAENPWMSTCQMHWWYHSESIV